MRGVGSHEEENVPIISQRHLYNLDGTNLLVILDGHLSNEMKGSHGSPEYLCCEC